MNGYVLPNCCKVFDRLRLDMGIVEVINTLGYTITPAGIYINTISPTCISSACITTAIYEKAYTVLVACTLKLVLVLLSNITPVDEPWFIEDSDSTIPMLLALRVVFRVFI